MPKRTNLPPSLKPYAAHGLDISHSDGDTNVMVDCPMCGKDQKLGIKVETGEYQCWSCQVKGNPTEFIRWLWDASYSQNTDYGPLAEERRLFDPETLLRWQVCKSLLTGEWLVPGFNTSGSLCQLYRWIHNGKKRVLLPTPELGHKLFGVNLYSKDKPAVLLCEGPWDAMKLWEIMACTKDGGDRFQETGSITSSLLEWGNVLATPGANVFQAGWLPLFRDKEVYLLYDNDHPRQQPNTDNMVDGAGIAAIRKVSQLLGDTSSVQYIKWGRDGDGYNLQLPSGHDVRDFVCQ